MQARTRHSHTHSKPSALDPPLSHQDKLLLSISSMNKSLLIYPHLLQYAQTALLHLHLPETLLLDQSPPVLLFSDSSGIVRVSRGDLAKHSFITITREKIKQLRNVNPQGVHFPQFIAFRGGKALFTIHRKADLAGCLETGEPATAVQRFIWPENFRVKKLVVVWKRTKRTKLYSISPRNGSKPPPSKRPQQSASELTLDSSYMASTHSISDSSVTREKMPAEVEGLLETLRTVLSRQALRPEERLEELLVSLCKSHDGKMYFLNAPQAKVSVQQSPSLAFRHSFTASQFSTILQEMDASERLKSKFLPYLNLTEVTEQSERLYPLHLPSHTRQLSHVQSLSEQLAAKRLGEVAAQFDSLQQEAQELKREFGIVMKVQLTNYPQDTLDRVIHQVYEFVQKDSRLNKYYSDRSRIFQKLMHAVKSVFLCGLSRNIRNRMHRAHMGLGITHADFDLYLKYFLDAMRLLEIKDAEVQQTQQFLESFRADVVQRLLSQTS